MGSCINTINWNLCLMMVVAGSNVFSRSQGKFSLTSTKPVENSALKMSGYTIQF